MLEQENGCVGHIVDMEKFAQRSARAPNFHARFSGQLRAVRLANQGGDHVARLQVEVVERAIEVGRHRRDKVAAILLTVGLTQPDAGDLGDRVPLVGHLQRSGQQRVLGDRLRGIARVDARRPQEHEFLDVHRMGTIDHIGFDEQVVAQKIDGVSHVGKDPANPRCRDDDHVGPRVAHPAPHLRLVGKVARLAADRQHLAAFACQPPDQRRTDHAAMASHPDAFSVKLQVVEHGHSFTQSALSRRGPSRSQRCRAAGCRSRCQTTHARRKSPRRIAWPNISRCSRRLSSPGSSPASTSARSAAGMRPTMLKAP